MTRRGEPLGFPWSQLTHICLEDCSLNDCHHILSQASTAIACTFDVTRSSSLEPTPVSHLHLQNLKLTSAVELRELWDCLTCSSLSTLYVEDPQTHVHGLLEFLSRSGKTIEDFTLDSSALDDTQSLACLRNMPILRRLTVEEFGTGTQFTDRVCEALTLASEGTMSPLVPNLEYLHLIGASFSHRTMARMLESPSGFRPIRHSRPCTLSLCET
ncbi:hypothetical protein DFH07DRAFT_752170 [Mycena maculata]|uniref:Uncharacterized protein n=1 Tax=Mycena maculata TaxID=230809 RepID=A0AAD7MZZ2_9AGAR|nr:hypothetical protein DFH07DRAFT_752170 [Mycena maculata]